MWGLFGPAHEAGGVQVAFTIELVFSGQCIANPFPSLAPSLLEFQFNPSCTVSHHLHSFFFLVASLYIIP